MKNQTESFDSTFDFIHICYEGRKQRLKTLARKLQIVESGLDPYKDDIDKIMDFIRRLDTNIHKYERTMRPSTALGHSFHYSLSSDLRALIILAVTKQNFQMNIILRHFIEFFIVAFWIDIGSQFTGGFNYYMYSEGWKPYWNKSKHRISWGEIRTRLEHIKALNNMDKEGFYRTYFDTANGYDFRLLLSLPICDKCRKNKPEIFYRIYTVKYATRLKTDKVLRRATYKTGFAPACHFCSNTKSVKGYVMGLLDTYDMIEMITAVAADQTFKYKLGMLKEMYDYLSSEFVHFATKAAPDEQPNPVVLGKNQESVLLWGLEGIIFGIKILGPLTKYYFRRFRIEQKRNA